MNRHSVGALAVYILLIAIYFTLGATGVLSSCEWFMVVPTLFASAVAFTHGKGGGWLIPAALLFSVAGDYGGAVDAFIPQVSCFAIAHILYICDFAPRCRFSPKKVVGAVAYSLPLFGYLAFILSSSHSSTESVAVGLYGVIIFSMGIATIFQERRHRAWYIVAAIIFIFSDAVIGYVRFVGAIPHAGRIIMSTYYAAQGAFLTLHSLRHSAQD